MREEKFFDRVERLLGARALSKLSEVRVILFGAGGVGSWCAESLVRTGVLHLTLVDFDTVCPSNVNRQLEATSKTVGLLKVEALRLRLKEISPAANIEICSRRFDEESVSDFSFDSYDYVVDAIDSLKDKALLMERASHSTAKLFSSMGAAKKIDPTRIRVAEFWKVQGCPLARALREKFRKKNTLGKKIPCVYGEEVLNNRGDSSSANGSLVHITGIFGLTLSGLIIEDCAREFLEN